MDDLIRQLLFRDERASEEERAALADALAQDADLARALRRWRAARQHVGEHFREDVPERRLLVLYALAESDGKNPDAPGSVLSDAERHELAEARPQIEAARDAHPALDDVIEEIRRERDAFDAAWVEHARGNADRDDPEPTTRHADAAPSREAPPPRADRPSASSKSRPSRRSVQRWGWRVAATLALVAFGAVLFFVLQRDLHTVTVTAGGEAPRTVQMADGSTVRLMPGATLSYVDPESGTALDRQATLEKGRAFFDIVKRQEGFVVETPTARVTVLGTRFGVQAEKRATRVVLASGRVALTSQGADGAPVTLRPGQASRVAAGARPSTPTRVESLSEALAWTGLFVFRSTPAEVIARQLAAHHDQTVTVAPALQDKEITGTFERALPLRETLRTVAAALGARVESVPGGYALVPGSGP